MGFSFSKAFDIIVSNKFIKPKCVFKFESCQQKSYFSGLAKSYYDYLGNLLDSCKYLLVILYDAEMLFGSRIVYQTVINIM